MTQLMFLDTIRCPDLLNSTGFFLKTHAGGSLVYSCSISWGFSCKTAVKSELWTSMCPLLSMRPSLRNLFMKMADAGSSSADHFRQCFLTNARTDRLRAAYLPEIREQQQHARKPPLARIE